MFSVSEDPMKVKALLTIGFFLPAFHARQKNSQLLVCFTLPFRPIEHAFFCPRQAALTQKQSRAARQTQAEKWISEKAA